MTNNPETLLTVPEGEYRQLLDEREQLRRQRDELQASNTRLVERSRAERQGGILSGKAIELAVKRGDIVIDPFVPEHINPASIDLTLGDQVMFYQYTDINIDPKRKPQEAHEMRMEKIDADGFWVQPGVLYLMHTNERIFNPAHVSCLDGKSSIGRLGVKVHETAGYGDTGFDGQYTLEVTSVYRTRLYAGMRIAQMRFHTVVGEIADYRTKGHYTGEKATGPVASMAWKQFREKP